VFRRMGGSRGWLPLLLLAVGNSGPLAAQLERPPTTGPTIVAAVASLAVESTKSGIWLRWPPAAGAPEYWVERVDNSGSAPVTLSRGPSTGFAFDGNSCSMSGAPLNQCVYFDARLGKGVLYSYRVWTGGGQSPVGSAKARCTWKQGPPNPPYDPVTKEQYPLIWACFER
jgi:hypothetical protein